MFKIFHNGLEDNVSIERLKPAHMLLSTRSSETPVLPEKLTQIPSAKQSSNSPSSNTQIQVNKQNQAAASKVSTAVTTSQPSSAGTKNSNSVIKEHSYCSDPIDTTLKAPQNTPKFKIVQQSEVHSNSKLIEQKTQNLKIIPRPILKIYPGKKNQVKTQSFAEVLHSVLKTRSEKKKQVIFKL